MKTQKTHRGLIEIIGRDCVRMEIDQALKENKTIHPYTEVSKGFAAIGRRIDTSREVVSRWHKRNRVPHWRWKALESITPRVKEGAFEKAKSS